MLRHGILFLGFVSSLSESVTEMEPSSVEHEPGRAQSWETLDADLRRAVQAAVDAIGEELTPARFVGAYLHGSLSMGCFYRPKSDVDILFVAEDRLSPGARRTVAEKLCDRSDDLPLTGDFEVSVVLRRHTQVFRHPLPYQVHYGESHRGEIRAGTVDFERERTDVDLAVHCAAVRERGVLLSGAPIADVFAPVPVACRREAILEDLAWILEDEHLLESPYYGVLNCCRALAQERLGWQRIISKDEGGEWALRNLPPEHGPVIAQALACYRSSHPVSKAERRTHGHAWDADALTQLGRHVVCRRLLDSP